MSRRLLRYYEEQGLLRLMRLANGYRECSESDIAVVYRIRVMPAVGVPTAAIDRLMDCPTTTVSASCVSLPGDDL